MKFYGTIGKTEVLILVDSGSVGSFVSSKLATKLQNQIQDYPQAQFITADGSPMICTKRIPQLEWTAQGHVFHSDVEVLPLNCFDMILGEDWLEQCSPMWVHWTKKIMRFMHKGKRVTERCKA